MNCIDAILTRRSVRKFQPREIPESLINNLLEAAMYAPSAGNQQAWQFIVIDDREILARITEFHPYAGMLKEAPVAVVVCGDTRLEKFPGYWVQDCSAATQNLLLAAHANGLGAVWCGVYPEDDRVKPLQGILNLPSYAIPLNIIAVGYPEIAPGKADRIRMERVHKNGWQENGG